ncbi:MAG: hypothetical protein E6I91_15950 [Chloroflexi bacterium]|nr:MAG: hypothetical protein E6I91_15950 [Chloroflexota bacterium]
MADETTTPHELVTPQTPTSSTQLLLTSPAEPQPRRRPLRIALALLTFLIGIIVGVAGVLLIILANSGMNPPVVTPPSEPGNITAQVDASLIGPIAEQSLAQAGIPGKISNIQLTFAKGDEMTITGQYQYSVLNIPITQHFTIVLQPRVDACKLQIHIIKANYGGIPATGFATIFQKTINQRMQDAIPSTIENGKYAICMVGVHTQPGSIAINFTVTPQSS